MALPALPASWKPIIGEELRKPYFRQLEEFLEEQQREGATIFPPLPEVFTALEATPYSSVKALILGQDPYHDNGQAHGLAFSVCEGITPPPSLRNIYKELRDDLGHPIPDNGYLMPWARQGVLLLNAVLTVQAHKPNSHKNRGWEKFTDEIIRQVSAKQERVVFVLWGGYARKKRALIDTGRHTVVESAHPSPLSAHNGFFGSRPFSRINAALREGGREEIDWRIPDL